MELRHAILNSLMMSENIRDMNINLLVLSKNY